MRPALPAMRNPLMTKKPMTATFPIVVCPSTYSEPKAPRMIPWENTTATAIISRRKFRLLARGAKASPIDRRPAGLPAASPCTWSNLPVATP